MNTGRIMSGQVFEGTADFYRGMTVKTSNEKCQSGEEFKTKLENSLAKWAEEVSLFSLQRCDV